MTAEIRELLPPETGLAWEAMRRLRPGIGDVDAFTERVDGLQRPAGYRLLAVFEAGTPDAVAVAGFRLLETLAWGRVLYLDDLSTVAGARRRGHAGRLLERLAEEAAALGCAELHLDSGVGADRHDAHRLYMRSGLAIVSHHFARSV